MGLDMYLKLEFYLSDYEHQNIQEKDKYNKMLEAVGLSKEDISTDSPSGDITFNIMYWRKANQIHKWFVQNVQDGEDDCSRYDVSKEQLECLLNVCKEVLSLAKVEKGKIVNGYTYKDDIQVPIFEDGEVITNPEVCEELLPTENGFFFGGTNYDSYYLMDVKNTIKGLEKILSNRNLNALIFIIKVVGKEVKMKDNLSIVKASWHRNGISGMGFYAIIFKDKEYPNNTMIASMFEESGYCAVYCIEDLVKGNIEFANGNSWRGDVYQSGLKPLLEKYLEENGTNRIGPFAL